ncbi:hypothetical protein V8E36_001737 [Tilletia maclaganii]
MDRIAVGLSRCRRGPPSFRRPWNTARRCLSDLGAWQARPDQRRDLPSISLLSTRVGLQKHLPPFSSFASGETEGVEPDHVQHRARASATVPVHTSRTTRGQTKDGSGTGIIIIASGTPRDRRAVASSHRRFPRSTFDQPWLEGGQTATSITRGFLACSPSAGHNRDIFKSQEHSRTHTLPLSGPRPSSPLTRELFKRETCNLF